MPARLTWLKNWTPWSSGPRTPSARTIEAIYGAIVAQSRDAAFYRDWGVPDTVEGRFDMIVLHLWLVFRKLRAGEGGTAHAQRLFDHFCSDMDANLREMGVGDLAVPKKMKTFGEAFYGRVQAYDSALADSAPVALERALARNLLNRPDAPDQASGLAAYVRKAVGRLDEVDGAALAAGRWRFPALGSGS